MKQVILQYFADNFGMEGDEALELYHSYLDTLANYRGSFDVNLEKKDADELRRAFHSIKGCAANCGDMETSRCAMQGEHAASAADFDQCKIHAEALCKLMDVLLADR